MYRVIQKKNPDPKLSKGVAVGWGIEDRLDVSAAICKALPGWAVVASVEAPLTVPSRDLSVIRKLSQVPASAPVILFGAGLGAGTLCAALIGHVLGTPWAVAVLGGIHTCGERDGAVLSTRVDSARKDQAPFVGVSTTTPVEDPAWGAERVLTLALGLGDTSLSVIQPLEEGSLFVATVPEPQKGQPPLDVTLFGFLNRLSAGPK